jgi:hypothetical protein
MKFEKRSKADWEAEALKKDFEAHRATMNSFEHLIGEGNNAALLIAAELRLLRGELKWLNQSLKKLAQAAPTPFIKSDDINF